MAADAKTDHERRPTLNVSIDHGVAVAEISNPPINLMSRQLFVELMAFSEEIEHDDRARVVVLRSTTPDFFIAHFDVELILSMPAGQPPEWTDELMGFHRMVERFRTMPKATICEIAGRVGGGGGELAASCDMRFGAIDSTVLCQMEVPLGILPGGSGTQRLPPLIGRGPAMEIILGGDDVDSATLERWGWLNRALPSDELRPFVDRLAARIAGFPAEAIRLAKESALASQPDPTPGLLVEAHNFQHTLRVAAAQERMRTFLERGGQTPEGEHRVGELGGDLGDESDRWLS